MLEKKVTALLDSFFEENTTLFLIDYVISTGNKINIIIDGDNGVTLQDCIDLSRHVEHNLDREEEDFSLEVASAGATEPLVNKRQYTKNLGRTLKIKKADGKVEGELTEAGADSIKISWTAREPKPVGKGKVTVVKEEVISYDDIVEAKVKIKF